MQVRGKDECLMVRTGRGTSERVKTKGNKRATTRKNVEWVKAQEVQEELRCCGSAGVGGMALPSYSMSTINRCCNHWSTVKRIHLVEWIQCEVAFITLWWDGFSLRSTVDT